MDDRKEMVIGSNQTQVASGMAVSTGMEPVYSEDPYIREVKSMNDKESQFIDFGSVKRIDDELFCDYRCRQWWQKRIMKSYLQGRYRTQVIWDSGSQGTRYGSFK